MEISSIIPLLIVVAFVGLAVAATIRLSRKKAADAREEVPKEKGVSQAKAQSQRPPKLETKSEPVTKAPAREAKALEPKPQAPKEEPEKKAEVPVAKIIPFPAPKTLRAGLERTRAEGFVSRLASIFKSDKTLTEAMINQVEEVLLTADIGVKTTNELIESLKTRFKPTSSDLTKEVLDFLQGEVVRLLEGLNHGAPTIPNGTKPFVIMVVGVNGTGKTTTIGKMAHFYKRQGLQVLLGAGDTFRAAGVDQLQVWGERVGVPVVSGPDKADPGAVLYDAAKRAVEEGKDVLIADTAGRLHTNVNLVEELKKVHRVLGKVVPGAPHEVLLVLDATMGQNAIRQAQVFREAVNVTGIVLAKLDGTAKGGVVLSIAKDMNLPIRFVGVGEGVQDLRPFDPVEFAKALFEES